MPKVSVITPAYNASRTILETIESVRNQSFQDWEMIIVDDCSTDDTFSLARQLGLSDSRIRVFQNEKNSGVAASRNKALEVAEGQFIAFLDADDLWLPQKLERQVSFMEEKQYALTYTDYQEFDSATGRLKKKVLRAPKVMTARRIYGDTSIGCLTVMVNKEIAGPFQMPPLNHMEDNITWQTILSRGFKGHRLGVVLALYRKGKSSLTGEKKKAAMQQWRIYREFFRFSIPKSIFYFISYAIHAVIKRYL